MPAAKEPIGVIGVGWVGLVTGACFAELGHHVYCRDIVQEKVDALKRGDVPIYEPGLTELVERNRERLHFTTDMGEVLPNAQLLFCCVDTPPTYSGDADLSRVERVVEELGESSDHAIVMKSTVPVGTGRAIRRKLQNVGYVSNPEFLKEGAAVEDFMHPDRVVVGAEPESAEFGDRVAALYEPLGGPIVRTDVASAEMVKLASNAFLATKISFINEIANVSEELGADVNEVARGMGLDKRIGPQFLRAGIGYGGSCLAPEETVLVKRHGRTTLMSFERLWKMLETEGCDGREGLIEPAGLEVLSWVPGDDEPRYLPATAVTRRPYEGDLVEVRTKMGRRVRCTPDHPWIVGSGKPDGDMRFKLAEELDETDWLPLAQGGPAGDDPALDSMLSAVEESELDLDVRERAVGLADHPRTGTLTSSELVKLDLSLTGSMPDLIWEQTAERKRALLSGLWEGDGSWSLVNGGPNVILEWGTISDELADGVMRLLGDIGIVSSRRMGRAKLSTKDTHWVRVAGADQIERVLELVPERDREGVLASIARQRKRIQPTGYRKFDFGPTWLRVVGTRRVPHDGFVYSLEVPVSHTFVTTGGLTTKNCFPKDVSALKQLAGNTGYHFQLLTAVIEVNELQKRRTISKLKKHLGSLVGKEIALLGVAFKPDTDDIREATSLVLAGRLQGEGANVRAYDPVAGKRAAGVLGAGVKISDSALEALEGADGAVLVTEWSEFKDLDWANDVKHAMKTPLIVDGRNYLDREALTAAGFTYEGVGR